MRQVWAALMAGGPKYVALLFIVSPPWFWAMVKIFGVDNVVAAIAAVWGSF